MPAAQTHQMEIDLGEGDEEREEDGDGQQLLKDRQESIAGRVQGGKKRKKEIGNRAHGDGQGQCPAGLYALA